VDFNTTEGDKLTVYTTRCDTLFGATYMVISPEHPCIEKWNDKIKNIEDVKAYQAEAAKKSDFERTELVKEKTGVMLDGVKAINRCVGPYILGSTMKNLPTEALYQFLYKPCHHNKDKLFLLTI